MIIVEYPSSCQISALVKNILLKKVDITTKSPMNGADLLIKFKVFLKVFFIYLV